MEEKMKIGVDLDEVIVEFVRAFLDFYNQKFDTNYFFEQWRTYNFWEVFGKTKEETVRVVDEFYNSKLFDEMKLIDGSKESIEKLAEKNQLSIVTSRPLRFREKTEKFSKKYFSTIPIKIFYSNSTSEGHDSGKARVCKREGIEIFIEDDLECAVKCAEAGVRVFLLSKPWNRGKLDGIIRVYNWKEILKKIGER